MKHAAVLLRAGVKNVIVKMGANGVLVGSSTPLSATSTIYHLEEQTFHFQHYKAPKVTTIINVTGAGDSLVGGVVWGLLRGNSLHNSLQFGLIAAKLSLESDHSVSELLAEDFLLSHALPNW